MMFRRCALCITVLVLLSPLLSAQTETELRFALRAEPKTFDPFAMASEEASETVRYLTSGVLIRLDRETHKMEPALATSWEVLENGRGIEFNLRRDISFSDGSPFTAHDVEFTMRRLMAPETHSPVADSFRSAPGDLEIDVVSDQLIRVLFPAPVANLVELFDEVTIVSAQSPNHREAVLGPFVLKDYRPGVSVTLQKNPYYWKRDHDGKRLPYLDRVILNIQRNEQIEVLRFQRGQIHLIPSLSPTAFERFTATGDSSVKDGGPSLDVDFLWFNQNPKAPLPEKKLRWFQSRSFRLAISEGINREDLSRIAFQGRATPAASMTSPANRFWYNRGLSTPKYDPTAAARRLSLAGFEKQDATLLDSEGQPVEFSLITNAGNKTREQMAAMIQQDLSKLGIRVNIVTLDFQALIARIVQSFDYEACLLGLVNVDLDPSAQMNVWLSSGGNHAWNPNQEQPTTDWETDIDRLMRQQATTQDRVERKQLFDEVQKIAAEHAPLIYLVHKNHLFAVSSELRNVRPGTLWPQTFWNADEIRFADNLSGLR